MEMRSEPNVLSRFDVRDEKYGRSAAAHSEQQVRDLNLHSNSEVQRLLNLASTLYARARDFESRLSIIEKASLTCKCAKTVSEAIIDILDEAKALLLKMREISDPQGRLVLARSFNDMLKQVDCIVEDGYYDSKNLAKNETVEISTDVSGREGFTIIGVGMDCRGLELQPFEAEMISNADIIDRLTRLETASNSLVAHSCSYDSIAILLQSRIKFARGMIDILEEGNSQMNLSRTGQNMIAHLLSQVRGTNSREAQTNPMQQPDNGISSREDTGGYRDSARPGNF